MTGSPSEILEPDTTDRRHICVVTETYPPEINGVAGTLVRLVQGLRARGHVVSVVRPRQRAVDGPGPSDDPELTLVRGVPLPGYRDVHVGLPAPRALRDRWTTHRPDVVYVATEGPLGWSAVRSAGRLGIPVFSGFHTNFHSYARHYRARGLQRAVLGYLRRFHNRTRGTLVASADLRTCLHAAGFKNLSVLGRGVDQRLFTPTRRSTLLRAAWGAAEDDLVVLYVGRLSREKNIPLAVEAYRAMQRVRSALTFVIVGDGPLRAPLQAAHPDLRFCGPQTGEQLAAHYASADVFLFPSETETFGNVCLEAAASGLVVVAYDYAAAHLYIRDGQTGVLAPRGEPRAFVERSVALASSPQSIRRLRERAPQSVAGADWELVVGRFETALTGPLAEGSRPTAATTVRAVLAT